MFRSRFTKVKDMLLNVGKQKAAEPTSSTPTSLQDATKKKGPETIDELLYRLGTKPRRPAYEPGRPKPKKIKNRPPLPPPPVNALQKFTTKKLATYDPTSLRQTLFSRHNRDAILPGDILTVSFRDPNTEPFSGVLLNIRRRGLDTAFLLRNQLTRVGVEMWYKLYSPKIKAVELVQRREKRARRAKLYYMRKPKHDAGSVDGVVMRWRRGRMAFNTDAAGGGGGGFGGFGKQSIGGKGGKGKKK